MPEQNVTKIYDSHRQNISSERKYSDEDVKKQFDEIDRWYEERLVYITNNRPGQPFAFKLLKYVQYLYKQAAALKMERSDIAVRETEKICETENDDSTKGVYLMSLGFLYLGAGRYEDASQRFAMALESNYDPYFSNIVIGGCNYGKLFAYIGLGDHAKAKTAFDVWSNKQNALHGSNEFDEETIGILNDYFAHPEGLYKMKVSNTPQNSKDEYIEDDEKNNEIRHKFPFSFHFELNKEFAVKNHIDVGNYPETIPDNIHNKNDFAPKSQQKDKPTPDPWANPAPVDDKKQIQW